MSLITDGLGGPNPITEGFGTLLRIIRKIGRWVRYLFPVAQYEIYITNKLKGLYSISFESDCFYNIASYLENIFSIKSFAIGMPILSAEINFSLGSIFEVVIEAKPEMFIDRRTILDEEYQGYN